jgi:membrane protein DedA with SNARE-associated domain/rhodanese-related sulfurtransferase
MKLTPEILFLNVFLEQLGLPVPSTPALILAGAAVFTGSMNLNEVLLIATLAAVIPNIAWYFAGKYYGGKILGLLCKLSLTPESCVRETETKFTRWGVTALLFSKFVPGFSTIAPPLAGAMQTSLFKFVLYDVLGTIIWILSALLIGYVFNGAVQDILAFIMNAGTFAIPVVLGFLLLFIMYRWWNRNRFIASIRMERITIDELRNIIEAKTPHYIFDIRNSLAIERETIPGAQILLMKDIEKRVFEIDFDHEIITYCACPHEASAALAAIKLKDRGFTKVRPLKGGTHSWFK